MPIIDDKAQPEDSNLHQKVQNAQNRDYQVKERFSCRVVKTRLSGVWGQIRPDRLPEQEPEDVDDQAVGYEAVEHQPILLLGCPDVERADEEGEVVVESVDAVDAWEDYYGEE